MIKLASAIAALSLFASGAIAQTTMPPSTAPTTPPAMSPKDPAVKSPSATATPSMSNNGMMTLTDAQAKAWINKAVYSSDGKNLGEVAAFARDASGKVTEMHADIGGFLGLGETRVRLMPSQFKMDNDRVTLTLTGEQAKALPHIAKN
jgi:hypothetical protein